MNDSPKRAPRRWFQSVRRILRGVRWCVLSLIVLVIAVVAYFANADLPEGVKRRLETELRAHGVDLQISRLRWRLSRGLVADDVRFGSAKMGTNGPRLSFREVELKMSDGAMLRLQFNHVDSLLLNGGKLTWLLSDPGQPTEILFLTNLQARLQLLPGDQWDLNHFTAGFEGATLHLAGSVTNASAFRDWKIFQGGGKAPPELLRERLRGIVQTAATIQFVKPPEVNVLIHGDARDEQSFSSEITVEAQGATTPWGTLSDGQLIARLTPPATNHGPTQLEFKLRADDVNTRWGGARQFHAELHAAGETGTTNLVRARLEILVAGVDTPWVQATNAHFSAQWLHSLTNPVPASGTVELLLTETHTPWAAADEVHLSGTLSPAANVPSQADESWGWWARLEPCAVDWNCRLTEIRAGDFESKEVDCGGSWRAPILVITNLQTEMYRGQAGGNASVDVATRRVHFACASDFDLQKAYPFLATEARDWLEKQDLTWEKPPVVHAAGSIVLPEWTNRQPNWSREVLPTLELQGDFTVDHLAFRQIPLASVQSHFSCSNQIWNLPDLVVVRPEGTARLALQSDYQAGDFYCRLDSRIDVKALRGLVNTNAQKALDFISYTQPPAIAMELWRRGHENNRIGFKGRVALTNFTFRGESASTFTGTVAYTNLFLLLTDGRVERPEGFATVSSVGVDITNKRAFMTNGYGTMDSMALVRTLGPKITELIVPYHFSKPPVINAYGVIPLSDDISMADLHFKIDGGPFEWMKFHSEHVSGNVDWVGKTMHLGLDRASFCGGGLTGTADFDFTRKMGSDFKLDMTASDSDLKRLERDLTTSTNLEGALSGRLIVTQANSEDLMQSWNGRGWVQVKDGLIWDIPIFGILSPELDKLSPGLGQSRATEARANFNIKNSVIRSDDLQIHSPLFRLLYRGAIGFDTKVDATAEAELGRDTPLVGAVVSSLLLPFTKLLEIKITGTLKEPKRELKYVVPRVMLKPFSFTWHSLKELWTGESAPATNTVPTESSAAPSPDIPVVPPPATPPP